MRQLCDLVTLNKAHRVWCESPTASLFPPTSTHTIEETAVGESLLFDKLPLTEKAWTGSQEIWILSQLCTEVPYECAGSHRR